MGRTFCSVPLLFLFSFIADRLVLHLMDYGSLWCHSITVDQHCADKSFNEFCIHVCHLCDGKNGKIRQTFIVPQWENERPIIKKQKKGEVYEI